MNLYRLRAVTLALALGASGMACESEEAFPNLDELDQLRSLHSLGRTPPKDSTNRVDGVARAEALGDLLFHDTGLSRCGTVSCASCHGGEGLTVSTAKAEGCDGHLSERNPPTLLNVAYNRWFMWDGRADRLWSQAILPLLNPVEMNADAQVVRARLLAESTYATEYQALFGKTPADETDSALLANVGKVMAAYQRTLVRIDAPFDTDVRRFIAAAEAGQAEADPAYLGLKTFLRKGQCIVCHKGPALTDDLFHNIGVEDDSPGAGGQWSVLEPLLDWEFNAASLHSDAPTGTIAARLQTLRAQADRETLEGAFRTPSLRNLTLTAPYMHTGEQATLEEVIDFYNEGGGAPGTFVGKKTVTMVPLNLSNEEKRALVTLLQSMTGTTPP
ncbi:cytochrome-c peroxidase [Myxococcus sp. Y35]|uniref:cytochrome-c peroxidase n=1 Tax=Pseudomyxococcus flavus TaxID=3115648 RepID=UPI003CEC47ED